MAWKKYPEEKPECDMAVTVCNMKYNCCGEMKASYFCGYDVFRYESLDSRFHPCLDVTHWKARDDKFPEPMNEDKRREYAQKTYESSLDKRDGKKCRKTKKQQGNI